MNEDQLLLCKKYGSAYMKAEDDDTVDVAMDTLKKEPLYGVRIMPTNKATGWYIWGGPHSNDPDFYQPVHLSHLKEFCPSVLKYLSLESGFKFIPFGSNTSPLAAFFHNLKLFLNTSPLAAGFFIINHSGYEDVWQEFKGEDVSKRDGPP